MLKEDTLRTLKYTVERYLRLETRELKTERKNMSQSIVLATRNLKAPRNDWMMKSQRRLSSIKKNEAL